MCVGKTNKELEWFKIGLRVVANQLGKDVPRTYYDYVQIGREWEQSDD